MADLLLTVDAAPVGFQDHDHKNCVETALSTDAEGVAVASADPVEDLDHSAPAAPTS